jgi:hypothetical protein
MSLLALKASILAELRAAVRENVSRGEKAKLINAHIVKTTTETYKNALARSTDKQAASLTIAYCYAVISIESRHRVWSYDYMSFSRRIGELWENFCSAAWDFPSRPDVARLKEPRFSDIRNVLLARIKKNVGNHHSGDEILTDVNLLFDIIGEINMKEDEVFTINAIPHVVDFKSGFGSNEKGNMLRLQTVGKAYKIWNYDTKLSLIVRQDANNNYLKTLKQAKLWSVFTGDVAYDQISNMTGADMSYIRQHIISWERDLPHDIYTYLCDNDLSKYLKW